MLLHALVRGRVQGVGFRWFVQTTAQELKLSGWVRNTPDGSVEVEAEGAREILEQFEERLRTGPRMSRVDRVDTQWIEETKGHTDFIITH